MVPRLSAGVITADLTRLGAELEVLRGMAAWAHVDVMDGVFCPQLTVGPAFVAAIASTGIPVDAHLMVDGSAIFDGRSPARNLEVLTQALQHPVACPIEEVAHGKR